MATLLNDRKRGDCFQERQTRSCSHPKSQAVKLATQPEKDTEGVVIFIYSLHTVQIKEGIWNVLQSILDWRKRPSVHEHRPFNNTSKTICHVSFASPVQEGTSWINMWTCLCSDVLNIDDLPRPLVSSVCTRHLTPSFGSKPLAEQQHREMWT